MIDLIQANIAAEERLHSSKEHFGMNKMLDFLFLLLRIHGFFSLPCPQICMQNNIFG